ncbi:hypothetical protein ACJRO7_004371 [Eucalyptus globulus]|uniref:Uncharacterized protein n=1 Tax=Eucalyptus globulus TaxID=34317 RepID=A0ABD3J1D8_EUCGL
MPLHAMPQSNPQHLVGLGQIPQANQRFGAQSTLYSGQPIPVSSQIPAGFQPLHPVPGFTTGSMNALAQTFHTAGLDYPQVPFHPHDYQISSTCALTSFRCGTIHLFICFINKLPTIKLPPFAPPSPWTMRLFGCMDDPFVVVACCFPCVTFGQIAEIVDRGSTSCGTSRLLYGGIRFLIGCLCLLSCTCRTKLQNRFNLIKSPAPDCITHFFSNAKLLMFILVACQGWQGNAANMQNVQYQVVMVPPMHQQAMRA